MRYVAIDIETTGLDPAILFYRPGDEKLPDLLTCCQRAGLDVSEIPHTAYGDNLLMIKCLRAGLAE